MKDKVIRWQADSRTVMVQIEGLVGLTGPNLQAKSLDGRIGILFESKIFPFLHPGDLVLLTLGFTRGELMDASPEQLIEGSLAKSN